MSTPYDVVFPDAAWYSARGHFNRTSTPMRHAPLILTVLIIGGCAGLRGVQLDERYGEASPRYRVAATLQPNGRPRTIG